MMILSSISNGLKSILVVLDWELDLNILGFEVRKMIIHIRGNNALMFE
jgi:hypothetical protein